MIPKWILGTASALFVLWTAVPNASNADILEVPGTYATVGAAVAAANDGDTIEIEAGAYDEAQSLVISKSNLIIKAHHGDEVTITGDFSGRLVEITGANVTIEDIKFDGEWRQSNILYVRGSADGLTLRGLEVKNAKRHMINLTGSQSNPLNDVVIENCLIHDALWFENSGGQVIRASGDAHGIVTDAVTNLVIRGTEIYYVSGDTIQFDRAAWDNMTIENCILWNGPLPAASARGAGFEAELTGKYPGENALDTKHTEAYGRPMVQVKNVTAYGWRSDYISNAAAFNLKEHLDITLDGITVYDSEIAFRTRGDSGSRGNARTTIMNAVVYDVDKAVRYEDGIDHLKIYSSTFGDDINTIFENGNGSGVGCVWSSDEVQVKNNLYLAASKPDDSAKTQGNTNLAVDASVFVDVDANDYHLASGSSPIDAGENLTSVGVTTDRDGAARPDGNGYDSGAYEYIDDSGSGGSGDDGNDNSGGSGDDGNDTSSGSGGGSGSSGTTGGSSGGCFIRTVH